MPNGKPAIVPSVLSANLWAMGAHVQQVQNADWLQIDVMDGIFVPNISFGPALVKTLRKNTAFALDAHLMITRPLKYIDAFAEAGADLITVHAEADNPAGAIEKIKALGLKAGLAVSPETEVSTAKPFINLIDLLLVMTVHPGFGGQKFMRECLVKVRQARTMITESGRPVWLQVDGGIDAETAAEAVASGADSLVAGNSVFGAASPAEALEHIRRSIK